MMDERKQTSSLLELKSRYLQHILAVSSPTTVEAADEDRDPCTMSFSKRACCPAEREEGHALLLEHAIDTLSSIEKGEMILELHVKLRNLSERLDDVITFSERTVSDLERAHQDAMRERAASEQCLLQELHHWKHHHPEVEAMHKENDRLREDRHQCQRQYLVALGKLARGKKATIGGIRRES